MPPGAVSLASLGSCWGASASRAAHGPCQPGGGGVGAVRVLIVDEEEDGARAPPGEPRHRARGRGLGASLVVLGSIRLGVRELVVVDVEACVEARGAPQHE